MPVVDGDPTVRRRHNAPSRGEEVLSGRDGHRNTRVAGAVVSSMGTRASSPHVGRSAGLTRRSLIAVAALGSASASASGVWRVIRNGPGAPDISSLPDLQTSDLIFQTSRSGQSGAIVWATGSPLSHCALVRVYKGEAFVIEASRRVRVTHLDSWVRRGQLGRCLVLRHAGLSAAEREAVWRAAKAYRGRPYDSLFLFGNRAIYCSELCWLAYKDALDLELGEREQVKALNLGGPLVERVFKGRWRRHPACRGLPSAEACRERVLEQPLITPASLAADERLTTVFDNYPPGL
jgi:hypothetical protein